MSKVAKVYFLIDAIFCLIIGAFLLIIPGRTLSLVGWVPSDPLMTRVVGAALLALGWGALRAWKASHYQEIAILVEVEFIFAALAALGLLRHLVISYYPPIGWITFTLLAVAAVAWGMIWLRRPRD